MREFLSLLGFLFVVSLIVEFFWWILGAIALVALCYLAQALVRRADAAEAAYLRYCAELASRAEQQHHWVLEGDERGTYGQYPVPDIVKEDLHRWPTTA